MPFNLRIAIGIWSATDSTKYRGMCPHGFTRVYGVGDGR